MADTNTWSLGMDADRVAWLVCDTPGTSTNVLSAAVLRDLAAQLVDVAAQQPAGVVIRSAKANGFIAGADIKEFLKIRTPEEGYELVRAGQAVLQTLEDLPCPSIAALHGFALGGGLELALACTYRVAADDATLSLGFPEVLLGLHPGFGGTVRSVQLIGVRPALDLMLKGKPYKGSRALAMGLIDELVPPPALLERAKSRLLASPPKATAPFVDKLLNFGWVRPSAISCALSHHATWYACSCCRIVSKAWAENRLLIFAMCMSSAPVSWVAISPRGRRFAA